MKRGAPVAETIYEMSIHQRDRWICGICHELIDRKLEWPNPQSASIDHRMPISAGGTHTRDNVQSAHISCNSRKGAKVPVAA